MKNKNSYKLEKSRYKAGKEKENDEPKKKQEVLIGR
jgi:hypothetical protein